MIKRIINLFTLAILCFCVSPAMADYQKQTDNVKISVLTNNNSEYIAQFDIKDGWHIYWSNPGDIGKPTVITSSAGMVKVLNQSFPKVTKSYGDVEEYIYENRAIIHFKIFNASENVITFHFVECNDVCKEETISFKPFDVPYVTESDWNNVLKYIAPPLPKKINVSSPKNSNIIEVNIPYSNDVRFIPAQKDIIDVSSISITPKEDKVEIKWNNLQPKDNKNQQKLEQALITTDKGMAFLEITYSGSNLKTLLSMVFFAFIAGILLNAMPCVFPVLSLKIFSLIRNDDTKSHIRSAISYTLGVLFSFWTLVFILLMLKKHGESVGWGFQLQSPAFLAVMIVIFILLFLMMADILHFPSLGKGVIYELSQANSFSTGFFSVLIASPCTGPFMGATIGYAFMQSYFEIYVIFTSLALGYALPYALIELFPQTLNKILPTPGAWMKTLKNILAVPLLVTAIWLASILNTQLFEHKKEVEHMVWRNYNEASIQSLVNQRKNVFILFTADWCLTCKVNEKMVLKGRDFVNYVKENNVYLFKADMTVNNPVYSRALSKYNRHSIPTCIYYKNGKYKLLPLFFDIADLNS